MTVITPVLHMSRSRHTLSDRCPCPGQCYISSVEADSPAHYAGLKTGDRILEVEAACVGLENQGQVVARIAASGVELSLRVADTECEEWHSARDIVITSGLPHVVSSYSALDVNSL